MIAIRNCGKLFNCLILRQRQVWSAAGKKRQREEKAAKRKVVNQQRSISWNSRKSWECLKIPGATICANVCLGSSHSFPCKATGREETVPHLFPLLLNSVTVCLCDKEEIYCRIHCPGKCQRDR